MAEWFKQAVWAVLGVRRCASLSGIAAALRFTGSGILDLCLPRSCAGCETVDTGSSRFWCGECLIRLDSLHSPLCPRCGRPFPDAPDGPDHLCGECARDSFSFDAARSAVLHSGIVRDRIHQFKFGGKLQWVPPLVDLLEIVYPDSGFPEPDVMMPVPLHVSRLRERGFNQSGLLAGELGRRLGLRVSFDLLVRKERTDPQTRLERRERLKNVRGAFAVTDRNIVRGVRVLLIDDVFTTGTTLSECAKTLKRNGASEVYALTVTRARPA